MLQQTFMTSLTDVFTIQYDRLGALRYENDKVYKYVKFAGANAVAAGDVVCYVATDNNCQTVDDANTNLAAGVAMAAVPSGSVQYGWILVEGVATLSTAFGGAPAVGSNLTTVGAVAPAVTVSAAVTSQIIGNVVNVAGKVGIFAFPH